MTLHYIQLPERVGEKRVRTLHYIQLPERVGEKRGSYITLHYIIYSYLNESERRGVRTLHYIQLPERVGEKKVRNITLQSAFINPVSNNQVLLIINP